ncbi:MAG: CoB--CoM heterodisulfide reductase iron-sulfur subunit B family protein [Candidatus Hydrothermarchaeaceae archaeon]
MKFSYYPGCALKASAKEYDMSAREVLEHLDVELTEIEDWSCCGATAVYNINKTLSYALPARNLAIAEKKGLDIAVPCPVCYYWLWKTKESSEDDSKLMEEINTALNGTRLKYSGGIGVKHILEILAEDIGIEKIKDNVKKPLEGLRVAPYYGCFVVKPPRKKRFDSPENPTSMDKIISATDATLVEWDMKTRCCGGAGMLTNEEVMLKLTYEILKRAKELEADCVVTLCPQCSMALDAKQRDVDREYKEKIGIPVLYFTQLLGLSFGIDPKKLGIDKNIVPAKKIVNSVL